MWNRLLKGHHKTVPLPQRWPRCAERCLVCSQEVSFFSLVSRGKQSHSEGKLQEALSFFLRAVDLKPGDPEVQLMTIQLYRRLSERS